VIVDLVRGEGVAVGREVPFRIPLGSDCLETVRETCEGTLGALGEWDEVIPSTDLQEYKRPTYSWAEYSGSSHKAQEYMIPKTENERIVCWPGSNDVPCLLIRDVTQCPSGDKTFSIQRRNLSRYYGTSLHHIPIKNSI